MANIGTVTVELTIDADSLNEHLGRMGGVPLNKSSVAEFLENMFGGVNFYCERCGSCGTENTGVKGSFEILD